MRSKKRLGLFWWAAGHFLVQAGLLFGSLYFLVPGEPGYSPLHATISDACAFLLHFVGFPVLTVVLHVRWLDTPLMDIWGWSGFILNSLLWGTVLASLRRRSRSRLPR